MISGWDDTSVVDDDSSMLSPCLLGNTLLCGEAPEIPDFESDADGDDGPLDSENMDNDGQADSASMDNNGPMDPANLDNDGPFDSVSTGNLETLTSEPASLAGAADSTLEPAGETVLLDGTASGSVLSPEFHAASSTGTPSGNGRYWTKACSRPSRAPLFAVQCPF